MLKLYGGARSRASLVQWYLEEIGVDYEFVLLNMSVSEHLEDRYKAINPFGKVPGLEDGEFKLWESGAILLYVAEKFTQEFQNPEARAIAAQWVLFANATLGPGVFMEATREKEFPRLMDPLQAILSQQPFMIGDQFSVVDVAVGSYLFYIPFMLQLDLSPYPAIDSYVKKLMKRPAFQNTIGKR
ncbi:MAG: glutathione S-transferase family protein [Cyanobacteria bacterium P01_E01_bin.34]